MMSSCRRGFFFLTFVLGATLTLFSPAAAIQPVADFGAQDSFTQGYAPFTVQFEDHSQYAASWMWTFGDGQTSNVQNPLHTYTSPGIYTVSLMVRDSTGSQSNSMTRPQYIVVAAEPGYSGTYTTVTTRPTTTYTGAIAVTSDPSGAMVSLDGKTEGITPITMYNIQTGSHTVLVHLKGYPDFEKTVTVEYQTTLNLNVNFVETVTSRPTTAYTTTVQTTTPVPTTRQTTAVPAGTPSPEPAATTAQSAAAPAYDRQAGTIHITCSGCYGLPDNGRTVESIQYQVYAVNRNTGAEEPRFLGEMKSSEEAIITAVDPGSYVVSVSPYHYRSQRKSTDVSADTVSEVRFEGPTFVRAPGFAAVTVLAALFGLAAVRRNR